MPKTPKAPKLTVRVTKEVMDHSRQRDSSHCMIAMAIRDALPAASSIAVDIQTIRFSLPEKRIRCTYLTPRMAQVAIIEFDQGRMPDPFSFKLAGAHVTSMYRRLYVDTPRQRLTEKQREALAKAWEHNPSHIEGKRRRVDVPDHPELSKKRLVPQGQYKLPLPVGGSTGSHPVPRSVVPGKRRAFGLRAMQH